MRGHCRFCRARGIHRSADQDLFDGHGRSTDVFDVNGDRFEVEGLGYPDADVVPVLFAVNTAFKRDKIHDATNDEFKEFNTGRRYPWAADRVM